MKILCIGSTGQVARSLCERSKARAINCVARGRPTVDLSRPSTIEKALELERPDIVINAAAYTAVDKAEHEQEKAFITNATGPKNLAVLTHERGIPLFHISTDYVFDGALDRPYNEDDQIAPIGVYGRTKAQGEVAVREAAEKHLILRTAWVYSPFGGNFIKTMLRLVEDRSSLKVVDDQLGNPTSALDIADALLSLSQKVHMQNDASVFGTYHLVGSGSGSWADLAQLVFDVFEKCNGNAVNLTRIPSSEYPTVAVRPKNSRMDASKLEQVFGVKLPQWRESAEYVVRRLLNERIGEP
ncbi:MAG: dTDP-4-dehydrorhamnose reductase [Pseudomonadota bacterium]